MAHNAHFLAYAAMMRGQSELAIRAARDVVHGIPEEFIERPVVRKDDPHLPRQDPGHSGALAFGLQASKTEVTSITVFPELQPELL
jgi:hypothetical protein